MAVRYIDNVPCIDGGGEIRKLAAFPPPPQIYGTAPRYSSKFEAVDPSTWADFDFANILELIIRNQATYGSCTGHAGVTAEDIILRKIGANPPLLSCTFPYAQVNGGRDQGASVSSILQVLKQLGTCTHAECDTDQIFKNQIPASAYKTALKYQVFEAFLCRTYEEIVDAINRGFPVPLGIQVGNNFSRLNNEGIAPLPDMIIGGHALCGIGIKKYKGVWLVKVQNSWGKQWGIDGCCYLTKNHFTHMIDSYAIMYAENTPPPIAKAEETKGVSRGFSLGDIAFEEMKKQEDAKFLEAVNQPLPEPTPTPAQEEPQSAPEPQESLLAQFQEESTTDVGTASLVHTDPDGVVNTPKKKH